MKLKIGSADTELDIRRAYMVREAAGGEVKVMLDANQSWPLPQAIEACLDLAGMVRYWIEEPTQPDDVFAHQTLVRAIAPMKIALGEHVPNRVIFKNFFCRQGQPASYKWIAPELGVSANLSRLVSRLANLVSR